MSTHGFGPGLGVLLGLALVGPARAEEFNLKLTADQISLGPTLLGPSLSTDDLKGKVVLLDYWGINCVPCLQRLPVTARLSEELADYGLQVLGPHAQPGDPEVITAKARSLGVTFPVLNNARVGETYDIKALPHCFLFDHNGKCLFRGDPARAEPMLRVAVGQALVARTGKTRFSKGIEPLVQGLNRGQPPAGVLQRAMALRRSTDAATAEEAQLLVDRLTAGARKRLEDVEETLKLDPAAAYLTVTRLATVYKGTEVGSRATARLAELKKDPEVKAEMQALPSLEGLRKLDAQLQAGFEKTGLALTSEQFKKTFAAPLRQMKTTLEKMKKTYPEARSTAEALRIGEKYGIAP